MSSPTSTTEYNIVHGPIRKAVLEEIKQLSTEAARAQATSLVKYYKTKKLPQGVHKDANGNWTLGENHHILPKSDGGSDDPGNKVVLPVAQHFYVHVLLARAETGTPKEGMYKNMVSAFGMTASRSRSVAPEEIEVMRIEAAKAMLGNSLGIGNSGNPNGNPNGNPGNSGNPNGNPDNSGNPNGNPGNSGNPNGNPGKRPFCDKPGCQRSHAPGKCHLSKKANEKKRRRQAAKQAEDQEAKRQFIAAARQE